MSMGELTRKDNSLCFRKDGKCIYSVRIIRRYSVLMRSLSIKLLDFLSQNNIIIHFYNYYGGYSGTYYPERPLLEREITGEAGTEV